jgi:Big-like domain-containing protein
MKIKNCLVFFILLSIILTGVFANFGCANIVPPLGGPRDTLPPRLITAVPADQTRQFKSYKNKIVFTFDEYIDLKDVSTNLIVSPVPKIEPIVESKLRTLTVTIKDTLQPNTTYSLNFGKAVRDVNEGNILKDFTYVFSTGSYIDSAEFSGTVVVANTGKADSSLIVLLHRKLIDSAVVNERPRYFTRVDTNGRFHFKYLAPGTYALYAMKDEGGTHRYLSRGQLFAFADAPVIIGGSVPPVALYAYAESADTKSTSKTSGTGNKGTAAKPSDKEKEKDKEKDKRLQFQTNITNGEFDVLDTLHLLFPRPLKLFDSTKLRFTDENFADINPSDYLIQRDTTNKKITLYYNWPTDTKFFLIAAKNFAEDSAGRKLLKIDTIGFHTKKEIDYGEVRIRIRNLDLSKNPVLLFIQSDAVKYSFPFINTKEFRRVLFPPGEYELRILYDDNKNGIWDPGEFFGKHRQPEKVITLRKKLNVKANWDNDQDVTL